MLFWEHTNLVVGGALRVHLAEVVRPARNNGVDVQQDVEVRWGQLLQSGGVPVERVGRMTPPGFVL